MMTKKLRPYQDEALKVLQNHTKGVCVLPTGAGKTIIFMEDVRRRILSHPTPLTIVIVAPKILLASQLASEFESHLNEFSNIYYSHIHSGENGTTDITEIKDSATVIQRLKYHHLLFTTYKSLPKILETGIKIDLAIFDEAHHSVLESNFVGVAQTSQTSKNTFFYTATPRDTRDKKSMVNSNVYGGTIVSLSPKELVSNSYILPPRVEAYEAHETDDVNIIRFIDNIESNNPKILVAVPSTKVMMDLFTETPLLNELNDRKFNVLHITSKYGCIVNNVKKTRQEFFDELNRLGNDDTQRLIIFHHSIISEGISIDGMTHALLLRNLSIIEYIQTIGRILRLHKDDSLKLQSGEIEPGQYHLYKKPCGVIAFPSNDARGNKIQNRLQAIVNSLFVKGEIFVA
jgi:superfamily II DNA or RNA helicase